jgi:DNA-binding NtrC family response regulator
MPLDTVILLGNITEGHAAIAPVVAEFDWSLECAADLEGLARICSRKEVVAVLMDLTALDLTWRKAIPAVHNIAPRALPILCHRFSDAVDWTEASAAGAFHQLSLPLHPGELRQSLGFVWAEKNKRFQVIPLTKDERRRIRKSAAASGRRSG